MTGGSLGSMASHGGCSPDTEQWKVRFPAARLPCRTLVDPQRAFPACVASEGEGAAIIAGTSFLRRSTFGSP